MIVDTANISCGPSGHERVVRRSIRLARRGFNGPQPHPELPAARAASNLLSQDTSRHRSKEHRPIAMSKISGPHRCSESRLQTSRSHGIRCVFHCSDSIEDSKQIHRHFDTLKPSSWRLQVYTFTPDCLSLSFARLIVLTPRLCCVYNGYSSECDRS